MLAGKLMGIAVQMLGAELVKGAFVGAFEHGPERFDAIDVHLIANILAG